MQKIIPFLWYDDQAEEAVNFYVSIFKNSKIGNVARYGEAGAEASGRPKGTVMTIAFQLEGQEFIALNGGPVFTFSPAISFLVHCATQEEVDELWEKLSEGGEVEQCGWLKDKYGLSWQIVPAILGEMMNAPDPDRRHCQPDLWFASGLNKNVESIPADELRSLLNSSDGADASHRARCSSAMWEADSRPTI